MSNVFYTKGKNDDWSTPKIIYDYFLDHDFYDPCKLYEVSIRSNIFNDFGNLPLFINPPYSNLKYLIEYAIFYHRLYHNSICLLIPVRADTIGFHLLLDYGCIFLFYKGRLSFGNSNNTAPFASLFVILTGNKSIIDSVNKNNLLNKLAKYLSFEG